MKTPNIRIFDSGGKTFDRYTVLIDTDIYKMSVNPTDTLGLNQWSGELDIEILENIKKDSREIELLNAPLAVRLAIGGRLSNGK